MIEAGEREKVLPLLLIIVLEPFLTVQQSTLICLFTISFYHRVGQSAILLVVVCRVVKQHFPRCCALAYTTLVLALTALILALGRRPACKGIYSMVAWLESFNQI